MFILVPGSALQYGYLFSYTDSSLSLNDIDRVWINFDQG
jgi:hypothetical protein